MGDPNRAQLSADLEEARRRFWFIVRDRDTKFNAGFDEVFASIGVKTTRTPVRSPRASVFAERFVRGPHRVSRLIPRA